ncbi:MAG: hypothetical protein ACI9MC_001343 [Kiritimatiellia bacterium]|jgi:hypothetical protein
MRTLLLISAASVGLMACTQDRWGQTDDFSTDTDPDSSTGSDTESDTGTETDSETETETDSETSPTGDGCHAYDPVNKVGLSRSYRVSYYGDSGTETQSNRGEGLLSDGSLAFMVEHDMKAGDDAWKGAVYYTCDDDGSIAIVEWGMTLTVTMELMGATEIGPVTGKHIPAKKYLPSVTKMGNGARWNGDYNIEVVNEGTTTKIETTGEYLEIGFDNINVPAGNYEDVYVMSYTYQQDRSGVSAFPIPDELKDIIGDIDIFGALGTFSEDIDAYAEYYYAKDVGLVYELTVDANTGDVVMEKELSSFTPGR